MGAHHDHSPAEVDPQAVTDAHQLWSNFTHATKYGVIAAIVVLLGMAYFLV